MKILIPFKDKFHFKPFSVLNTLFKCGLVSSTLLQMKKQKTYSYVFTAYFIIFKFKFISIFTKKLLLNI
ncbi:hypothetical protein J2X17_002514 [Flavobacterium aquidurense]|nr:hypothetical protein [Flavobacterium aquidurense]